MKKFTEVFLALCTLSAVVASAQFPYGTLWSAYPPSYRLSSGFVTKSSPGLMWLGYNATTQNVQGWTNLNKNFFISGTGQSAISTAYQVFETDSNCSGPYMQVLHSYGVSAIESSNSGALRYAVAGSYSNGCYFTGLNNAGIPLASMLYRFQSRPGNHPLPSKPIIAEDVINNEYYICGSANSDMYVLKVDPAGNLVWSVTYRMGNGIFPSDMIVNPYSPQNIIIVGKTLKPQQNSEGVMMELNGLTGSIVMTRAFGNNGSDDEFLSVCRASATQHEPAGFVIGGYNKPVGGTGRAWVIRTTPNGVLSWSHLIQTSSGANTGVIRIMERQNTAANYEFYGLLSSATGMTVIKLEPGGTPFPVSFPASPFNEFTYDLPALLPAVPSAISFINGVSNGPMQGLQIYGTAQNWPGSSSSYVVSAYFNGITNCFSSLSVIPNYDDGPGPAIFPEYYAMGTMETCDNFLVTAFQGLAGPNIPCLGLLPNGSNTKEVATSLDEPGTEISKFAVSPNPVSDKASVHFRAEAGDRVSLSLFNSIGQLIHKFLSDDASPGGEQDIETSFSSLNLAQGIYYVFLNVNGSVRSSKVFFNP